MKAGTAYKLKLAYDAIKKGIPASVTIRGVGSYPVTAIRDAKHTITLTLADHKGFIAVDPDDIVSVWVHDLPPAFKGSQLHAE